MKRIRVIAGFLIFSLCISGAAKSRISGSGHVVLFHFNDLHGQIDVLSRVAWVLEQERGRQRDVFLLVAGDSFTGNPVVDQHRPPGLPIRILFDRLKVTATAWGNHELDYGQEVFQQCMKEAGYKFLCANVDAAGSSLSRPRPYLVLKTSFGLRFAVLALIQVSPQSGTPDTHPLKLKGLRFFDPLAIAKRFAYLKKKYPLVVLLTHMGFDQDVLLAQGWGRADVIIGGHSHTVVGQGKIFNNVLVTQAGSRGRFLGKVDLIFEKGRCVSRRASLIDLSQIHDEDPQVKAMVAAYNDNPGLDRVILASGVRLTGKDELGSLMTDAMCRVLDLEMAFCNNGGIRLDELPPEIRVKTIYQLDPFQNGVVKFNLNPEEIRALIRCAFQRQQAIDLQVSGLNYTVVLSADGHIVKIDLHGEDGRSLQEDRLYSVGLSTYLASAYAFEHKDKGASLFVTTEECLIRFLEKSPDLSLYRGRVRARVRIEE